MATGETQEQIQEQARVMYARERERLEGELAEAKARVAARGLGALAARREVERIQFQLHGKSGASLDYLEGSLPPPRPHR